MAIRDRQLFATVSDENLSLFVVFYTIARHRKLCAMMLYMLIC